MDNGLLLNENKLILQLKLRNISSDFEIGTLKVVTLLDVTIDTILLTILRI